MSKKDFRHVRKTTIVKKPDGGRIKLGSYRPDKKNPNDKTFQPSQFSPANLPPKVDLRPYMTPVENQGASSSCTANAMAGAYEYLMNRVKGSSDDVSRLFIYYNARELDGDPDKDEGTYLRSCIKVLQKHGTCSETTWPFDLHRIFEVPHNDAYDEATNFLIEDAYRVDVDLDSMRSCLAEGYPFTFGLELFGSFQKAGANGLIPMPDPDKEQHDGGHAMLCVGYSDSDKVFIVRNSWGEDWGDRGYCYIPYDYMTNPELNGDLWSIRRVSDSGIDLSQGIQGSTNSLFDLATAAIANAIQDPGSSNVLVDNNDYAVEYEEQSVYVDGKGFVAIEAIDNCDLLEALYYHTYEDEYEEYTVTEESEEETEETEASNEEESEESEEETEETEDSYEEESEEEEEEEEESEEETEDSYEEESEEEESEEEEEEEEEETEDSYEESEEETEETEGSYEEESEESEEEEESEEIEDSYEEESEEEDYSEDEGGEDAGEEE
jgi:hypothetical protein